MRLVLRSLGPAIAILVIGPALAMSKPSSCGEANEVKPIHRAVQIRGTPLMQSMSCSDVTPLAQLLGKGADPNERAASGESPIWFAATYYDLRFLRLLRDHGGRMDGETNDRNTSALLGSLSRGFQTGNWDNYYYALEAGADPNLRYGPMPGITVAEKAVGLGLYDKVLELLDRGYKTDLDRLESFAKSRQIDADTKQAEFKRKVLARLATR